MTYHNVEINAKWKRHVSLRSKLAGHFYDIGRMHFAGTYSGALFEDIAWN